MNQKLVTIATFDQAAKARLAQNALAEAGIRAAVADEATVAMDWLLGNAIGWIKLQVLEEDAERAVAELERTFGEQGEKLGSVDPEALDKEALESESEYDSPVEEAFREEPSSTPSQDHVEETRTEREQFARRAFHAALFGLLMPVILFYAIYLLQVVAFSEGKLGTHARRQVWAAVAMTAIGTLGWWCWVIFTPSDFFNIL
jgi:Putative prokaryotic signal transducing protein